MYDKVRHADNIVILARATGVVNESITNIQTIKQYLRLLILSVYFSKLGLTVRSYMYLGSIGFQYVQEI